MPIIPFAEGSQVEVPGNPVQIHNPDSAGMMGAAVANAGDALTRIGDQLDRVATASAQEAKKAKLVTADADYQMQLLKVRAQAAAAAPVDGDSDGTKAVQAFQDAAVKARNDYANSLDPSVRATFMANSEKEISLSAQEVYANEIKKRAADTKVQMGQAGDSLATLTRADPTQAHLSMGKAELLINNSAGIPEAQKDATIRTMQQNIARAAANGFADTGENGQDLQGWAKARKYLTTPMAQGGAGELFDEKDKEQMVENLQRRESSYLTNQNQKLDRDNKLADRNAKDTEKDLTSQYFVALGQAGPDANKRAPILQQIDQDVAAGKLSPEKAKTLVNPSVFTSEQDNNFEQAIRRDIVLGNLDSQSAARKVQEAAGRDLSYGGANKLYQSLQGIKENEDRSGSRLISQVQAAGKVVAPQINISPVASPLEVVNQSQDFVMAQDQVHKTMLEQPNANPSKAAADALRPIVTNLGIKDGSSPQEIDKILKDEATANITKQQQGLLSAQEAQAAATRAHGLLMKKKLMLLDQEAAKANGAGGGQ